MNRTGYRAARFLVVLAFFLVSIAGVVVAADDVPRISIEALKKMQDDRADVVILAVQSKSAFDKGHIKGAISFPWRRKLAEDQVAELPRNKPIVTYCDCGPGEADSESVAEQLLDMGFKDVKVLQDPSIQGWKTAGYPTE